MRVSDDITQSRLYITDGLFQWNIFLFLLIETLRIICHDFELYFHAHIICMVTVSVKNGVLSLWGKTAR